MDLVSVVVPVYNAENTIEKCVDSIKNQTYSNIEIILVNDGSTDNSLSLLREFAKEDNRIKLINQENSGVSSARNNGIEAANGDYLVFVDSDDYVLEDYISAMITAKSSNPDCSNIWCGISSVSTNTNELIHLNKKNLITLYNSFSLGGPVCKLYDLKIIKELGIRMPIDLSLGEDLVFNLEYLNANSGKIVYVDSPLYFYTDSGSESLVHKYREDLFEINSFLNDRLKESMQCWNSPKEEFDLLQHKVFINTQDALYNELNPKKTKPFISSIKKGNQILKSKAFQEAIRKYKNEINRVIYFVYKSRSYLLFYIINKLRQAF